MEKKKAFNPGDTVASFTGQEGIVLSPDVYGKIRSRLKEGKRPGHYFAPGCCHNPDYITQIPVLFEDGTYDVMRAMNLKRISNIQTEKWDRIQRLVEDIEG